MKKFLTVPFVVFLIFAGCSFQKADKPGIEEDKSIHSGRLDSHPEDTADKSLEDSDLAGLPDFELEPSDGVLYDEFTEEPESLAHINIPDTDIQPVLCVKEENRRYIEYIKTFFEYSNDAKLNAAINFLAYTKKNTTQQAINRSSGLYHIIKEVFEDEGVPYIIGIGLVSVESAWKLRALSRARAAGLFQFIKSTGKRYDLRRTSHIEERYHIVKAARASAKYLSDLYNIFGDWKLALAAYNAGEGRIFRAMVDAGYNRDWHKFESGTFLKRETKEYVSKVLAAMIIWENPDAYELEKVDYQENNLEEVKIDTAFSPRGLAQSLNLDLEHFKAFNPHLLNDNWIIPPSDFSVLVPYEAVSMIAEYFNDTDKYKKDQSRYAYQYSWDGEYMVIRIQKGMTLSRIARMYNTTVNHLMHLNNLRSTRIVAGKKLKVPAPAGYGYEHDQTGALQPDEGNGYLTVRIRRGMTLYEIARQYNTSISELQRINNLKSSRIVAGQFLKIPAPST